VGDFNEEVGEDVGGIVSIVQDLDMLDMMGARDEFIRSCVRIACEAIRLFYASCVQPVARNDTVWLNHGITLRSTPHSTRLSGDGTK
jgi:hypothetical protein